MTLYLFLELLRCFGESTLIDLVQLLFTRLAMFSEDVQDRDTTSSMDQVCLLLEYTHMPLAFVWMICHHSRTQLFSFAAIKERHFRDKLHFQCLWEILI